MSRARRRACGATSTRWSSFSIAAPRCSTTATASARRRVWVEAPARLTSPVSCPRTSGRCFARAGGVKAPIGIGRDRLDSGSVASPYRETEAMRDGTDAIADWPILNALLNTASGASWVSFHHGGGVGIGRSIHAGMVVVADGTADAARKLERVLTNDPGTGVMRHADAGYERAIEVAHERGVHIPMK